MRLHPYCLALVGYLTVSGLLLMTACHPAQDPQPTNSPEFSFVRTFRNVPSNSTQTVNYPADSLTYAVTRFHHNLRIELAPKKRHLGDDDIIIRLDSAALLPGLVGSYTLPQLDTTTYAQRPSPILAFYLYTTQYSPSGWVAQSQNLYSFLPGSSLNLTSYDANRQTVSGRFEFRFPVWDPAIGTYVINRDWRATISGEFVNLPITP